MNQIGKCLFFVLIIFMHSIAYSGDSILTLRLAHPDSDKLMKLPSTPAKVDKNQYELFTKDNDNYWISKKVELDVNDIKLVKILITRRSYDFGKEKNIEISQKEMDSRPELRSSDMKGYIAALFFSKEGSMKLERITEKNIRRRLAIIFDNRLITAPIIQEKISGDEIHIIGLSYDDATRLRSAINQYQK